MKYGFPQRQGALSGGRFRPGGGFTLVEMVLALAILGIALSSLIYLREKAIDNVTEVLEEGRLEKMAQELLEEQLAKTLGQEMDVEVNGDIEGYPGWHWEWFEEVTQEGDEYIIEYRLVLSYPNIENPEAPENTYELSRWMFPTQEQLDLILEEEMLIESGEIDPGTSYGGY